MAQKCSSVCQSRGFQGQRQTDFAEAHGGQQAVGARPQHAAAGSAQILVDDLRVPESQLPRVFAKGVLQLAPLGMPADLQL